MIAFYWRLFFRQAHLGIARLFLLAVVVIAAAIFTSSLLNDRLGRFFMMQKSAMLAADLVLQSTVPLTDKQRAIIEKSQTRQSSTLTFRTMLNTTERFLLVSVKAVAAHYPLRGALQITTAGNNTPQGIQRGPNAGEVWLEARILQALGLNLGEYLQIGRQDFLISAILVFEPDRGGNSVYSFVPRVMMHRDDVASTGILQPGSRLKYRYLFAGEQDLIAALQSTLAPSLLPSQKIITVDDAKSSAQNILGQIQSFFDISALLSILLGVLGAGLASYQYHQRLALDIGVLRCIGLSGIRLRLAMILPLGGLLLIAVIFGGVLGWLLHEWIVWQFSNLALTDLPPPGIIPFLLSGSTVIGVVAVLSWPFWRQLAYANAQTLMDHRPLYQPVDIPAFLTMAMGLSALVLISSKNPLWSALASLVFFLFAGFFYAIFQWLLNFLGHRTKSVRLRLSSRFLLANRRLVGLQVIAIALALFVISVMSLLTNDLWDAWNKQIPEDAPNFFVVNLAEEEIARLQDILTDKNIPHSPFYPIVRGRLSAINGQPVREYASKESKRDHESLHRDLSLSIANTLPKDNEIIAGRWHNASANTSGAKVSVEAALAEKLAINVGDALEFTVATNTLTAEVGSLRRVRWESFAPNFYMLFAPGDLAAFPATYLVSLRVNEQQKADMSSLMEQFSGSTFFDIDFILKQLRNVIEQAGNAIRVLFYLAVAASFIVFICVELLLQRSRLDCVALLRVLGADMQLLHRLFLMQFLLVGFSAGAFAYVAYLAIGGSLISGLLALPFAFNPMLTILCLVGTPVLIWLVAHLFLHGSYQKSAQYLGEKQLI